MKKTHRVTVIKNLMRDDGSFLCANSPEDRTVVERQVERQVDQRTGGHFADRDFAVASASISTLSLLHFQIPNGLAEALAKAWNEWLDKNGED